MDLQEEVKDNHHDVLQRISLEFSYKEIQDDAFDRFNNFASRLGKQIRCEVIKNAQNE